MTITEVITPGPGGFKFLNMTNEKFDSFTADEIIAAAEAAGLWTYYELDDDGKLTGLAITTKEREPNG